MGCSAGECFVTGLPPTMKRRADAPALDRIKGRARNRVEVARVLGDGPPNVQVACETANCAFETMPDAIVYNPPEVVVMPEPIAPAGCVSRPLPADMEPRRMSGSTALSRVKGHAPAGQTKALDMVKGRWAGAGAIAPVPEGAVPVTGGTATFCPSPATYYSIPGASGQAPGCYAANATDAATAASAISGGAPTYDETRIPRITSAAQCRSLGGTVTDGSPAMCEIQGVSKIIEDSQSSIQTAQIVGTIATTLGTSLNSVLTFINNENNRDLQLQLAEINRQTQLQIAALNSGNAALSQQYQQQAAAQQSALLNLLMQRMGNQQQGSFQSMLPMLAIGALAIGGAYVLTRR